MSGTWDSGVAEQMAGAAGEGERPAVEVWTRRCIVRSGDEERLRSQHTGLAGRDEVRKGFCTVRQRRGRQPVEVEPALGEHLDRVREVSSRVRELPRSLIARRTSWPGTFWHCRGELRSSRRFHG